MNSTELTPASQWILTKYIDLQQDIDIHLSTFEVAHAIESIYKFLWDSYAQWYVEYLKTAPNQLPFAKALYKEFIITASPFIPFEAEVLWKEYFGESQLLAHHLQGTEFLDEFKHQIQIEKNNEFESIILFISSIRSTRGLFAIDPATSMTLYSTSELLQRYADFVAKTSRTRIQNQSNMSLYTVTISGIEYSVDILAYISDKTKEIDRTKKLITELTKQKVALEKQLTNEQFISRAGELVVEEKRNHLGDRLREIDQQNAKLGFLVK